MNANSLLFNSQKWFVESDVSTNDAISYVCEDGTRIDDLKVFINHISENENTGDKNLSKATLTNVILTIAPKQNDSVKLPNDTRWWKVQNWRKANNMYVIEITADRRKK